MSIATEDQKRRAWDAVAGTLGIYVFSTRPDDPAAKFGYECALNAIIEADKRAALANPFVALTKAAQEFGPRLRAVAKGVAAS